MSRPVETPAAKALDAVAAELQKLARRCAEIEQPYLAEELGRLAETATDEAYRSRHGHARYCSCPGHDGEWSKHEADRQRLAEEQRRRDAEAERRRREAESPEDRAALSGWA